MPASAQLGVIQQGQWQLAAPGSSPYTPPFMPTSARPWMAHLYNNDWSFRASLGPIIGRRPVIRQTMNSGIQPVTIELPTLSTTIQPGNLIVITEQGGNATGSAPAGFPVIGGTIEQVPDKLDVSGWKHEITITPFVAELGDAYLNRNYSTATDVAQMARDAVSQTNHLRYTPTSIPNTGVTALYNFSYAPALEVIDHARLMAGVQWSWFVDAIGVVWFQPINTTARAMFTVTPKDYSSLQSNGGDISGLKNFALVVGGIPNGGSSPATATYTNPTSNASYGLRTLKPPTTVPGVTDQPTLNNIAATIGGIYDRVIHKVTIDLPAYPTRILLGQPGGATMRYSSPSKYPLVESEVGSGTYSANYVVLEVSTDGIEQQVTIGDVPSASLSDVSYQVERLVSRTGGTGALVQAPFVSGGANILNAAGTIQNASGTVADTNGLAPVAPQLGVTSGNQITTSSITDVAITGALLNVTLTQSTRVLIFFTALVQSFTNSGGPEVAEGDFGQVTLYQNDSSTGTSVLYNSTTTCTIPFTTVLTSGSYKFDLRSKVGLATTTEIVTCSMFILQLGRV